MTLWIQIQESKNSEKGQKEIKEKNSVEVLDVLFWG
jgi:hypothetical protein